MDILEAIKTRHSVRSYTDRKIDDGTKNQLQRVVEECNIEGDMHIQLCIDEPNAFDHFMARYGKLINVKNYIAIVGKKVSNLQEKSGYYGEKIVLEATKLGLNTCWVGLTYGKGKTKCEIDNGEKLCCVIALGYGETQGVSRNTKTIEELSRVKGEMPDWFRRGMEAAQLAPTAVNQQRFLIELEEGNVVKAKAFKAFYSKLDLGIVKYHFEVGAGTDGWKWDEGYGI